MFEVTGFEQEHKNEIIDWSLLFDDQRASDKLSFVSTVCIILQGNKITYISHFQYKILWIRNELNGSLFYKTKSISKGRLQTCLTGRTRLFDFCFQIPTNIGIVTKIS